MGHKAHRIARAFGSMVFSAAVPFMRTFSVIVAIAFSGSLGCTVNYVFPSPSSAPTPSEAAPVVASEAPVVVEKPTLAKPPMEESAPPPDPNPVFAPPPTTGVSVAGAMAIARGKLEGLGWKAVNGGDSTTKVEGSVVGTHCGKKGSSYVFVYLYATSEVQWATAIETGLKSRDAAVERVDKKVYWVMVTPADAKLARSVLDDILR